jgi:hypothetical protein
MSFPESLDESPQYSEGPRRDWWRERVQRLLSTLACFARIDADGGRRGGDDIPQADPRLGGFKRDSFQVVHSFFHLLIGIRH